MKTGRSHRNVEQFFTDYLRSLGLRQTPERRAVLKEIFEMEKHFNVEMLLQQLRQKRFSVSRATLYNTVKLLLDSRIIRKHHFQDNKTYYESTQNFSQHDHIVVCENGEVFEFCDPRIQLIQDDLEKQFGLNISTHSLVFFAHKLQP